MVVENNEVMRQGLSMLLADYMDIKIVGESPNDEEVVRVACEFDPGCDFDGYQHNEDERHRGHPEHPC